MDAPKTGTKKTFVAPELMQQVEKDMTAETNRLEIGYVNGKSGEVKSVPVGSFASHRD